jgi:hypothetical protein
VTELANIADVQQLRLALQKLPLVQVQPGGGNWAYCVEKVGATDTAADFRQQRFRWSSLLESLRRRAAHLDSIIADENRQRSFSTQ